MIFDKTYDLCSKQTLIEYLEAGSYYVLAEKLANGKFRPTHQTVKNNIWKWCCRNPEESYEVVRDFLRQGGNSLSRDEWEIELVWNSRYGFGLRERNKWLNEGNRRELLIGLQSNKVKRYSYGMHSREGIGLRVN